MIFIDYIDVITPGQLSGERGKLNQLKEKMEALSKYAVDQGVTIVFGKQLKGKQNNLNRGTYAGN